MSHQDLRYPDTCVFKDVLDMHGGIHGDAACHTHPQIPRCQIPMGSDGPVIVSAGWSCKNLSKRWSPTTEATKQKKDWLQTKTGTTGDTFHGFLQYIQAAEPPITHFENVRELLTDANWQYVKKEFESSGYAADAILCRADACGYPTIRERAHGLALHMDLCSLDATGAAKLFTNIFKTLNKMKIKEPVSIAEFMLDDNN